MKKIVILIILLATTNTFAQKHLKFKPGVEVIQHETIANYKKPESILFTFKGHTHNIIFFLDFEKSLRKIFKRKMKKEFKNFKLDFNYELNSETHYKNEIDKIPNKKYNSQEYQASGSITMSDFKGWDNHLFEKRKQNYILNIELQDIHGTQIQTIKLNVNSFYTIITQNRNSIKLIYNLIMVN